MEGGEQIMLDKIQNALQKLDDALEAVREIENCREKSIAITHLETAELWLMRLREYEK